MAVAGAVILAGAQPAGQAEIYDAERSRWFGLPSAMLSQRSRGVALHLLPAASSAEM